MRGGRTDRDLAGGAEKIGIDKKVMIVICVRMGNGI